MQKWSDLKKHGEKAWQALLKELHQLKDLDVFKAVHASTLTDKQKKEALREISVSKEKRDGSIKRRTCADGRSQPGKYTKEEATSPNVSNDSIMLILIASAIKGRDVNMVDVAGAVLKADISNQYINGISTSHSPGAC